MEDITEQPERRINTLTAINNLSHSFDMFVQSQNNCNSELLKGISDLKIITTQHGKTLYGNGQKGICEDTRRSDERLTLITCEIEKAKVRIWGLIFAVVGFIVVELIKLI
jgi:hypothetical protein